ncbi:AAA family ATPase [Pseudomonas syringae pv. syringae]|uniref:TrlF family AAA-like ATPase n=1 Tax=Pseudomonas syringae TaxID=317 RepID=UPI0023F8541D|nr:AAA family ATPase [Pseudomonas syringae]MDF5894635.1 AAA family ATPase [Pseudomonas syringae pv. syringae]
MKDPTSPLSSGSRWLRWDPHVHAPGTLFNDLYKGDWEGYLNALEKAVPTISAIAVTDYYLLDTYRQVLEHKRANRLPDCDLIFPNVELRLDIGTSKSWVNAHLLVCPDGVDHLEELERFLASLTFKAFEDEFPCTPSEMKRLGRRTAPTLVDDQAALRHGAERFKVSFRQLREKYRQSQWAQQNILIGVAGKQNDGTAGLQEGADEVLRLEIERFAHIIFASNPNQREFWLGNKAVSQEQVSQRYDGLKPCLHGSDAHQTSKAGVPDGNRYCWLKGRASFDTLRQACIDPGGRAYVGEAPPSTGNASEVISRVKVENSPWMTTPSLELNPGLIAVIGARGSGKTALADIIAAGCDARGKAITGHSFLVRASEHLKDATVAIEWCNGDSHSSSLYQTSDTDHAYPRARYLSQQFVEELCSADGMTDGLLTEVERVIYESHNSLEREGAVSFDDLRNVRSERHREARRRAEEALQFLSERINVELEKKSLVAQLKSHSQDKDVLVKRLVADRANLVAKGAETRVERLEVLTKASEKIGGYVRYYKTQEQQILLMQDEVHNVRGVVAPNDLRDIRTRYTSSGLEDNEWSAFFRDFNGNVEEILEAMLISARSNRDGWLGIPLPPQKDANQPYIQDSDGLEQITLARLEAEISRLQGLVSLDKDTANRFKEISQKINAETELLRACNEKLADHEGASKRLEGLITERYDAYKAVFAALISEETVLKELYAPIKTRLNSASGTLKKLSFSVARTVDIEAWADEGESLLNLTKRGPFRGRGTLRDIAEKTLSNAWKSGDDQQVLEALKDFISEYQSQLLAHAPVASSDLAEYRKWTKKVAKWLYGTDHISIRYEVNYDGVEIPKLSPGTRGIVLLLLYLSLDAQDSRPLIIDQPEENLDPKSIYHDLVPLFINAKSTRQVIMVTHNANLVVNTDADQIIIAESGPHTPGQLPPILYLTGGLEDKEIRERVCDILEGGEIAFTERARRLRVRLSR